MELRTPEGPYKKTTDPILAGFHVEVCGAIFLVRL